MEISVDQFWVDSGTNVGSCDRLGGGPRFKFIVTRFLAFIGKFRLSRINLRIELYKKLVMGLAKT